MSTEKLQLFVGEYFSLKSGRDSGDQAGYQLAALLVTLGISIVGGFITGKILSLSIFNECPFLFSDLVYWVFPEAEKKEYLD